MTDATTAEPYPQMTMQKANIQCRPFKPEKAKKRNCPVCGCQVILHCDDCYIQVTGCLCVWEALYGEEIAREKMIEQGFWLPKWGEKPRGLLDARGRPINPDSLH